MVEKVNRAYIEAALVKLEAVDIEAANALRAITSVVYWGQRKPFDLKELLLQNAEFARDIARNLQETE